MEINSSQIPPVFNAPSAPSTANHVPINRPKAGNTPLIKTVIIILLALLFIGAILLAYYFYSETISLKEYKTNFSEKSIMDFIQTCLKDRTSIKASELIESNTLIPVEITVYDSISMDVSFFSAILSLKTSF